MRHFGASFTVNYILHIQIRNLRSFIYTAWRLIFSSQFTAWHTIPILFYQFWLLLHLHFVCDVWSWAHIHIYIHYMVIDICIHTHKRLCCLLFYMNHSDISLYALMPIAEYFNWNLLFGSNAKEVGKKQELELDANARVAISIRCFFFCCFSLRFEISKKKFPDITYVLDTVSVNLWNCRNVVETMCQLQISGLRYKASMGIISMKCEQIAQFTRCQ